MVIGIAEDPSLFTFLPMRRARSGRRRRRASRDCRGPDASYDVIVLDAFSSDAVPAHLLTREAFELYQSLRPGGVLLSTFRTPTSTSARS